MHKKNILRVTLFLGVICITAFGLINYSVLGKSEGNIKLIDYNPPTIAGKSGYQIDKYEDIQSEEWLNENEVLTLNKKDDTKSSNSDSSVRYFSIYNLNTKESKKFKDINIYEFLGVSQDKKYALYSEPRDLPKVDSDDWQKANDSGDLYHKKVKIFNLSTGEITDLNTEKNNSTAEFKWVGNNKILVNYHTHWAIIDTNAKVYVGDKFSGSEQDKAFIAGTDDIKDLGESVEGKYYYFQNVLGENGGASSVKMCSIDIKTKETKAFVKSRSFTSASKKGNSIAIGDTDNEGSMEMILDNNGRIIRNISITKEKRQSDYILSPDGSKAAYIERDNLNSETTTEHEQTLKVIDIKEGEVKKIVKSSNLKDQNEEVKYTTVMSEGGKTKKEVPIEKSIDNICWSSAGKELSFTYGCSDFSYMQINTFIVSTGFSDMKTDTYIVSFDK